jgi:SAM-dependent methyltransferase
MFGWKSRGQREEEQRKKERRERRKAAKLKRQALRAAIAEERVAKRGHRSYVGGHDTEDWYGIGKLQFHYLVSQGLLPKHRFLDIACGSLRLGQYLIPYLEPGNYRGLEGEQTLVEAGLAKELHFGLGELRKPAFAYNYDFDFGFVDGFDYAIAQSLFTHLVPDDIRLCFRNLRPKADPSSRFYFTFFDGNSSGNPAGDSHAAISWRYSPDEMKEFCTSEGWNFEFIGDWKHPRLQQMAVARKR